MSALSPRKVHGRVATTTTVHSVSAPSLLATAVEPIIAVQSPADLAYFSTVLPLLLAETTC